LKHLHSIDTLMVVGIGLHFMHLVSMAHWRMEELSTE